MDNSASKGEVCHPSDKFAALLAAQYAGRNKEQTADLTRLLARVGTAAGTS